MIIKMYGKKWDLKVGGYAQNPMAIAILLEREAEEEMDVLTVNLRDAFVEPFTGFIDINNHPEAPELIEKAGIGKPYTKFGQPVFMQSGYCKFPLYQFDREKLEEIDSDGVKIYLKGIME